MGNSIRKDCSGGAAVEFGLALPIFLLMLFGTLELGALFLSSAGLKHGVNAAARNATLYPTPSDDQLKARALQTSFGIDRERLSIQIARGTDQEKGEFIELSGAYESMPMVPFAGFKSQILTETRVVWVQEPI